MHEKHEKRIDQQEMSSDKREMSGVKRELSGRKREMSGNKRREALSAPRGPAPAQSMPDAVGSQTNSTWQHHLCQRQSRSARLTPVVLRATALPCQQAAVERSGSLSLWRGGCEPSPKSPLAGSASGPPASLLGPGALGTHSPGPSTPTPTNSGASRFARPPHPLQTHNGTYTQARWHQHLQARWHRHLQTIFPSRDSLLLAFQTTRTTTT